MKDRVTLRNFTQADAETVQRLCYKHKSLDDINKMFAQWNEKEYEGRYFEMFAVVSNQEIVGQVSLYQHSESVISCGPEIYEPFRRQGYATEIMIAALEIARRRGYKMVFQQVRVNNVASVALHQNLGFETDHYVYINKKGNEVVFYLKVLV